MFITYKCYLYIIQNVSTALIYFSKPASAYLSANLLQFSLENLKTAILGPSYRWKVIRVQSKANAQSAHADLKHNLKYSLAVAVCYRKAKFINMKLGLNKDIQYIPKNMHTVFALLCFVVVIYWLIFAYPSGLLHWHCGNLTIAPVPAKQPWWIWINTSWEFIMNDCITTTKQSTTKPCAYFLGYTVFRNYTIVI